MSVAPAAFPPFVCPRCRGGLASDSTAYRCAPCAATYPVVFGIPDFRVEPDPWIGLEDDRAKARRLLAATEGLDLAASVAAYWAMTPGTPPALARRFAEHVLGGERRAAEWLDALDAPNDVDAPSDVDAPAVPNGLRAAGAPGAPGAGVWLEVGCASGDLLAVAHRRGVPVVGVDVAMRWLVLARKRAGLAGGAQPLVCANGEHLPFAAGAFSRVVSLGTLEHCRRAEAVLAESARVLRRGGRADFRTTNRYSLLPEPHVHVWGVGLVPRRYADAYVRWRTGQGYVHHRPLSRRELGRGLRRAGFSRVRVAPARLLASDRERLGRGGRAVAPLYAWARRLPAVGAGLGWVAPQLDLEGTVA